jgi:pimeloyl-ACP methyl ester carboxylesterase
MAHYGSRYRGLFCLLPLLAGCAGVPVQVESRAPLESARGIVFVLGGAGSFPTAQRAVAQAADELHLPLHVRSFEWGHGLGRGLADEVDYENARLQGLRLAEEVCRYRQAYPSVPISLVGYSAGSAVVLAAAESLPVDSLERIVLLAPAVSSGYDLRCALRSARCGMDVFTSRRDVLWLGLGMALAGTADRTRQPAAGRVGFCPPQLAPPEAALAMRLRQHPWDPSQAWTGNPGSHAGSLQPMYLRAYVMPLLAPR